MPLYDFACEACGSRFEARVAAEEPMSACPSCGAATVKRVFSPFSGPFTIRPRGYAARRSDSERRAREEQRVERREQRRAEREQHGSPPRPPKPPAAG